jgi:hypothetical protein
MDFGCRAERLKEFFVSTKEDLISVVEDWKGN